MNWSINFDKKRGIVGARQWGHFTLDDEAKYLEDIVSSPYWKVGIPLISDYRHLHMDDVDHIKAERVRAILRKHSDQLGQSKLAMLCRTDLQYGLGRQLQILCDETISTRMAVFRDEKKAINWLLVP